MFPEFLQLKIFKRISIVHIKILKFSVSVVFLIIATLSFHFVFAEPKNPAPLFDNLGNFHRPIQTKSALAQRYFDQGLTLLYSFEFGEAIRSFEGAVKTDPTCAMCHWGLALALGSKTDMPLDSHELEDARNAINNAKKYVNKLNSSENLFVKALAQRYTGKFSPEKLEGFAGLCSSFSQVPKSNTEAYAQAIEKLTKFFPKDADAKTLYAAALFDVVEWDFWDKSGKANPTTTKIINTLEEALALNKNHPGANHLYVHVIQASPFPERALLNAKRLHQLVPGSEHMAHMAAHTYYSLGLYHDAVLANQDAIKIYKNYEKTCSMQGFKPETQYLYFHNIDYLAIAASMEGNKDLAIQAAQTLAKEIAPDVAAQPFLQKNLTPQMLMPARFAEWQQILQIPKPDLKYQYAVGIWHYTQGLAQANLNRLDLAKQNLQQLQLLVKQGPVEKNLDKLGYSLLQIASNTLEAVILFKENNIEKSIQKLQAAIIIQDQIDSFDPPPWYFPVRELLGQIYLKNNLPRDAAEVFLADLKRHKNNGWSLYGLFQSEQLLGHKDLAEKYKEEFKKAWQYADIKQPVYPIQ